MKRRPPGERVIFVDCQERLETPPTWPVVLCAVAEPKLVVPKSANGSVWQSLELKHAEGASTIHSAEVTSINEDDKVFVNERRRVRSSSFTVTVCPVLPPTVTLADMRSPGWTRRPIVTEGAGTS